MLLANLDFEKQPLVGVTSTLYKDRESVRCKIALETAEKYSLEGYPLIVVDASPDKEISDEFRERGANVINAPRAGLASQYINGVEFAVKHGAELIVRHEPEKLMMVNFADQIIDALKLHDILVIGRTAQAMETLPKTQALTERVGGALLQEYLDFPQDCLSGGRAFNKRGASHFIEYDLSLGDNFMHLHHPLITAKENGLSVGGIQVDLFHPYEMTAEEEGTNKDLWDQKRYQQLGLQIAQLIS